MLVFIIPIKSSKVAKSWSDLCAYFERTLRSVCNQTSSTFHVIVVCNEKPSINFHHPQVTYLEVDIPIPEPNYTSKMEDRAKKVAIGLLAAQDFQPTHIMPVDADDCISNQLAAFVNQNQQDNGWYMESGYEYEEGSRKIIVKKENFYKVCGTCNIINYRLLTMPEKTLDYDRLMGYDRFLSGHPLAKGDLAERGTPIQPLPFMGTIYIRDMIGESVSLQEPFLAKLKRNPKEAFRGIKKLVLAPFQEKEITEEMRREFNFYPLPPQ
jgi:hypothetical protein